MRLIDFPQNYSCPLTRRNDEDNPNSAGKRKRKKREHDDDDGLNSDDDVDRDDDAESYSMIESPLSTASPNPASDGSFFFCIFLNYLPLWFSTYLEL